MFEEAFEKTSKKLKPWVPLFTLGILIITVWNSCGTSLDRMENRLKAEMVEIKTGMNGIRKEVTDIKMEMVGMKTEMKGIKKEVDRLLSKKIARK